MISIFQAGCNPLSAGWLIIAESPSETQLAQPSDEMTRKQIEERVWRLRGALQQFIFKFIFLKRDTCSLFLLNNIGSVAPSIVAGPDQSYT